MNAEKYNRTVTLLCPTCGSDQLSHEGDASPEEIVTCARCGLKMTREDITCANAESIDLNVQEIGKQVVDDFKAEITKAFRGNKFIKIK
jgi:RNA polymerase subunit RPABC4/transcription elongation factor Spt4